MAWLGAKSPPVEDKVTPLRATEPRPSRELEVPCSGSSTDQTVGGVLDAGELKLPLIPESGASSDGLGQKPGALPQRTGSLPPWTVSLDLVHRFPMVLAYPSRSGKPRGLPSVSCEASLSHCVLTLHMPTRVPSTGGHRGQVQTLL